MSFPCQKTGFLRFRIINEKLSKAIYFLEVKEACIPFLLTFSFFPNWSCHDQTGTANSLSLRKGRNGKGRENKSCLFLLQLRVRRMSGLCTESSGCSVTFLLLSECEVFQNLMKVQKHTVMEKMLFL